jgi:hypothetical protein
MYLSDNILQSSRKQYLFLQVGELVATEEDG